jgi:DNA processing protein
LARDFAKMLASVGFIITSGLALGIDSQSTLGALGAHKKTLSALGNGLQKIYPVANKALAEYVLERGALVSELSLDYGPISSNFPQRNRIISGMSTAVLVVEAALKSGSLITARCAMVEGRDVFAIPGSIHNPMARGCHSLIRRGAKLVERIQYIKEEFGPMAVVVDDIDKGSTQTQQSTKGLDADEKLLLYSIGYRPVNLDNLVEITRLDVSVISRTLLKLELYGLLESLPGGSCIRKS